MVSHEPVRMNSVSDTIESLRQALDEAAENCDLILTSGGVSMGDWDLVRKIMEEEGDLKFWRVKIRPEAHHCSVIGKTCQYLAFQKPSF